MLHKSFLLVLCGALLTAGCHKSSEPSAQDRAKLMAEEIDVRQAQCAEIKTRYLTQTQTDIDLKAHFTEAKQRHCLLKDI